MFVLDRFGNPVLLVESEWSLGWIREHNPNLEMNQNPFSKGE